MKYVIMCPTCGEYTVDLSFKPVRCAKCGENIRYISYNSRKRVESAKKKMDELKPQIEVAHDKYMELMVLYENECQLLRSYARRGSISREEVEPYLFRKNKDNHKKDLNTLLKEYRKKKAVNGEG